MAGRVGPGGGSDGANAILNLDPGRSRTSPLSTMSDRWTGSHLAQRGGEIYETFAWPRV
jgi:hypothetical protein